MYKMETGCFFVALIRRDLVIVRVLIVDDSNFSQKITANLLKQFLQDSEFYYASDGQEGFDKYKEINPDYIFIDLLMPKINGQELIQLIKQHDSSAKIIVISADVQKSVKEDVEKYHIVSFINKPFNKEKAELICNLIRKDKDE